MIIKNEAELQKLLEKTIDEILKDISMEILKKLVERITEDVYGKNSWYYDGEGEPTEEFLNAWEWTSIKKKATQATMELFYNSDKVSYDGKTWKHGNPGESAVETLPDILNLAFNNYMEGFTSDLMFGDRHFSHKRKPYWSNLIKELFDKKGIEKMVTERLRNKFGAHRITVTGGRY